MKKGSSQTKDPPEDGNPAPLYGKILKVEKKGSAGDKQYKKESGG